MPICIRPVLGNEKLFLEVFFIQVFHLKLSNNYRIYNLNNLMKYDVRINLVGAQNDLHIPFMKKKKMEYENLIFTQVPFFTFYKL